MKDLIILNKGIESSRRQKIITISKRKDKRYLPQLIDLLNGDETYENKRHIIRALGNIGDPGVLDLLKNLLISENGLILGEIAESIGKFKDESSKDGLIRLKNHPIEWVRKKVEWSLKQLEKKM